MNGAFNQEEALIGAFSVIVQLHRLIDLRHYLSFLRPGTIITLPSGEKVDWIDYYLFFAAGHAKYSESFCNADRRGTPPVWPDTERGLSMYYMGVLEF